MSPRMKMCFTVAMGYKVLLGVVSLVITTAFNPAGYKLHKIRNPTHRNRCLTFPSLLALQLRKLEFLNLEAPNQFVDSINIQKCNELLRARMNSSPWELCLLEKKDLSAAAELSVDGFLTPRLESIQEERQLTNPFFKAFNAVERWSAWLSNYIGFWNRGGTRLIVPSLDISKDSILLVAIDKSSDNAYTTNSENGANSADRTYGDARKMASIVEISLENANGRLPAPYKSFAPLNMATVPQLQPYLSNLCVHPTRRRQGLGRYMCEACEIVAAVVWQRDTMYLHVEKQNTAAQQLYESMEYVKLSLDAFMSTQEQEDEDMHNIFYYRKQCLLNKDYDAIVAAVAVAVDTAGAADDDAGGGCGGNATSLS